MQRREFLGSAAAAATIAALSTRVYAAPLAKPRRVGLIGSGWYGKCDLLQLLNVEPVEVVSLCDVDSKMLDEAAELFKTRHPRASAADLYRLSTDVGQEGARYRTGRYS